MQLKNFGVDSTTADSQRKNEQAALVEAALQSELSKTLMIRYGNAFAKVAGTVVTLKCGVIVEASFVNGEILLQGFPVARVLEIDALLAARTRFARYKGVAVRFCKDNKVRVGREAAGPPSEALIDLLSL